MKVTICCITKNEDIHLERLINNIRDISENIIIVDSFSEDQTQKIAHKYNCFFYQRIFDNFSNQKNFCLSKVQDGNKWVLFLDADEFISDELKNEIKSLNSLSTTYDAYKFKRKFFWKNTWIKRGYYPLWFLRLGRKKYIKFDDNKINEHMLCSTNKIGILKGYFIDYNLKNTVLLELFNLILNQLFFDILRTEHQLGYIVKMSITKIKNKLYLTEKIQSDQNIYKLKKLINMFNSNIIKYINECNYDKYINILKTKYTNPPNNMSEQISRYFDEIIEREYIFDRNIHLLKILENISKNELIEFSEYYINKSNRYEIIIF